MKKVLASWQVFVHTDLALLILAASIRVAIHLLTNHQYGFHRDELAMLDDARHLAWGYVTYPPLTAFLTRLGFELFGASLSGLRLLPAISQGICMLLVGRMAGALGGKRPAQLLAAVAAGSAPVAMHDGATFQYVAFDYFFWVLLAYGLLRLLHTDNPRWWLLIGVAIGLGMMNKFTMAFLAAALVVAILLTPARRYLRSPWLWAGAALALLIYLPNLLWQIQHNFISLDFLSSIHGRDIEIGRTDAFLIEQFFVATNPVTLPLWVAGLYFYLRAQDGSRYRTLGWMFVAVFGLFLVTRGRSYYTTPAYPMLLAAGAVCWQRWLAGKAPETARRWRQITWGSLAAGTLFAIAVALPLAPFNSAWYHAATTLNDGFKEEIGWPELVATVARVYTGLPAAERAQTAILAANYGVGGAINLYGPAYGLPPAISGINSFWARGYGDPPPAGLILVGFEPATVGAYFKDCRLAAQNEMPYGIQNEEATHPGIYVCGGPNRPWPDFWKDFHYFG